MRKVRGGPLQGGVAGPRRSHPFSPPGPILPESDFHSDSSRREVSSSLSSLSLRQELHTGSSTAPTSKSAGLRPSLLGQILEQSE
jgi:hypothetical protein